MNMTISLTDPYMNVRRKHSGRKRIFKPPDSRHFGFAADSWFKSFLTPVIVMVVIPFSLIGVLPAHGLLHAFFTATSMIGFMAGAGIVVRNSIILVDFIEMRLAEGHPLAEAVIEAGMIRFRPIMLTALAVVAGATVILTDPIFQGLAIALMAGSLISMFTAPVLVPLLYFMAKNRNHTHP